MVRRFNYRRAKSIGARRSSSLLLLRRTSKQSPDESRQDFRRWDTKRVYLNPGSQFRDFIARESIEHSRINAMPRTDFYHPYFRQDGLPEYSWGDDPEVPDQWGNDLDYFEWLKNHDACKPDLDHWSHMLCRPQQAAAIMVGVDPKHLPEDVRQTAVKHGRYGAAGQFRDYEDLFRSAIEGGHLPRTFSLLDAAKFAIQLDVAIPSRLQDRLSDSQERTKSVEWLQQEVTRLQSENDKLIKTVQAQPKEESGKSRTSRSKMIIVMAVDRFGYDPSLNRTRTSSTILGACQQLGIRLTDDTIRTQLSQAFADIEDEADDLKHFLRNRNS
jgi:hypothetical protein